MISAPRWLVQMMKASIDRETWKHAISKLRGSSSISYHFFRPLNRYKAYLFPWGSLGWRCITDANESVKRVWWIRDQSVMNPWPEWIHRLLWCTILRVILIQITSRKRQATGGPFNKPLHCDVGALYKDYHYFYYPLTKLFNFDRSA